MPKLNVSETLNLIAEYEELAERGDRSALQSMYDAAAGAVVDQQLNQLNPREVQMLREAADRAQELATKLGAELNPV
ncbi:MAG: hypothetical protein GC137_02660 [Alphaproteobacteria bacterium]|nr:hypothetical protein [Alphaproteobacteria bacterium]